MYTIKIGIVGSGICGIFVGHSLAKSSVGMVIRATQKNKYEIVVLVRSDTHRAVATSSSTRARRATEFRFPNGIETACLTSSIRPVAKL